MKPRHTVLFLAVVALAGWSLADARNADDDPQTSAPNIRSRVIEVDGRSLHCLESGPASREALLLLHGARYRAETWRGVGTLQEFARQGRRVVAIDLPGFGESPEGPAPNWAGTLEALDLDRVVLLAPSMSGRFAFPFLIEHPEQVAGFVAVAPVGIEEASKKLQNCPIPALMLWGEKDDSIPVEASARLAAGFADAEQVVLAGARHACYLDAPKEFHAALRGFVDRCLASKTAPILPIDDLGADYVNRPLPSGFPEPLPPMEGNEFSEQRFELGRALFFDSILSSDRSVSCASCHQPDYGFASPDALPPGVHGQTCNRNAPTLFNRAFAGPQMWDGRVDGLEAQVLMPIEAPNEMGLGVPAAVQRLQEHADYPARFQAAYDAGPSERTLSFALATFVRRLWLGNSPVDRFRAADVTHLDRAARQGLWIFESRGGCWKCHSGPNFSDELFHNTGIGVKDGVAEEARFAITKDPADRGRFRTPTLRGLVHTGPYMHDGSLETLEEVVEFYRKGGNHNPDLDTKLLPLTLSDDDVQNLVAFLHALSETVETE